MEAIHYINEHGVPIAENEAVKWVWLNLTELEWRYGEIRWNYRAWGKGIYIVSHKAPSFLRLGLTIGQLLMPTHVNMR